MYASIIIIVRIKLVLFINNNGSYGCWGTEARQALSQLASRLAVRTNTYKSQMLNSLYGRLNLTLIRCNARAILSRSHFASCEQVVPDDVFVL